MMHVPTALLLSSLTVGLLLSCVALSRALVGAGVAGLRLQLWQVHDEVVDSLVAGSYSHPDQALEVLATTRNFIFHAKEFSFLRVFGGYALIQASGDGDMFKSASKQSIFEGKAKDELLNLQVEKLSRILALSVFRTSLIGHVGMVLLPIAWVGWRLVHRRRVNQMPEPQRMASRPIRTEVKREIVLHTVAGTQHRELASVAC
jgi:hypothetical protein